MRARRVLASLLLLATMMAFPGCTPPEDIAYVEDENARLKQLLIQYENDARNNQVMITEANGRVQRTNLELEAANRKIGVYEQEIPRLRNLAVQAAQTAQASNQAQYAQYQQYVEYMNKLQNQNRPTGTGQGTLRSDLAQQLSSLADQFGGVVVGNRLELPGDFFFDSGRYNLNPNARAAIRRMAEILAGENLQLMVVGHTDNDPIKNPALRSKGITDNLHLSLLRAKAVVDELKKAGYPSNLMYPTGWGELRPIVPNTDRASKKLNRRVDILIDPTSAQTMGMSEITGVEPVATASYDGTTSLSATTQMVPAEPMATTYTQAQTYSSSPSYSTIESIEPAGAVPTYGGVSNYSVTTTYDNSTAGGTADLLQPSYGAPSYSAPSYSEPTYSVPQQPQPYMEPYNPSPGYTTTLEPIAMAGPRGGAPMGPPMGYPAGQRMGPPMGYPGGYPGGYPMGPQMGYPQYPR